MATRPIPTPVVANLPTNWALGQTVSPTGTDVGLTAQHGYNYLGQKVNEALNSVNSINAAFDGLATTADLTPITESINTQFTKANWTSGVVTLPVSGWSSSNSQTFSVSNIGANTNVIVSLQTPTTSAVWQAAAKAGLRVSAFTSGTSATITLTCEGIRPTVALPLRITKDGMK